MENTYNATKAAKFLGVTVKTLQRWEREDYFLPAGRTPGNRRFYTENQLRKFVKASSLPVNPRKHIAYCRVSSAAQRPDLKNQRKILEEFVAARGLANVEFIEEIAGGLNFKRKKFLNILDAIGNSDVKTLVLAHPDRLTRFGYDWFLHYAKMHDCEVLVLNQEHLSPEQEMVQDLMTIVHCFSSRLYGLRNYRKKLQAVLKEGIKCNARIK